MILLGKLNFLWLTLRPVQYVMKFTSERAWKQVVCLVRWGYRHRKKYSVAKWKMRRFWDQLSHQNHCTGEFISISSFFSSRNKVTDFIYKLQIWEATGKRLKSDVGSSPKSLTSWMTLRKLTCFWALLSVNKIRLPPTQTARIKWCVPFTIKSSTNACPPSLDLSEIPVFFQDLYLLKENTKEANTWAVI